MCLKSANNKATGPTNFISRLPGDVVTTLGKPTAHLDGTALYGQGQCSRLKPSYEFHFEGLSNFNRSFEGLVQIQDVNPRM